MLEASDTALLARFGMRELAAVGLAAAIYEVVVFFTFGLADGIQIIAARRAGQDRPRAIGDAFFHGTVLLLGTAAVLCVSLAVGTPYLTEWIVQSASIRSAVNDYLGILAFAVVFHAVNMAYSGLYVGMGRGRALSWATAVLAVTNIVFDYVLIFGAFGFPRLGIRGAALGSLLAEIATCAFFTAWAVLAGDARRFGLFALRSLDSSLTRLLLGISWPAALERLAGTARWFLFFLILERIGEGALAVANMVYAVYALLLLPINGLAEAVCTTVSNVIGQGRQARIGGLVRQAIGWGALVVMPVVALAYIAPRFLLALFTTDPDLAGGTVASLRIVCLAVLVMIPAQMVLGAVAGTGDTRTTLRIELITSACMLGSAYAAGILFAWPVAAVWGAEIVGWVACLAISLVWLKRAHWREVEI